MTEGIRKILIANRGEIAVRVIRACRELGIGTVAIYSDADRCALHVLEADEAWRVGPPPASESYLRMDRILEIARASGADALHPGYGFLSENPAFARACRVTGVVFIGPPPEAMEALGDKSRARALMVEAGVPVLPGTPPLGEDLDEVARLAGDLGYPVLIKAAAGGGGKGMRVVRRQAELKSLLAQARGEARSAFGDDRVFLEKLLERARHIEVQVLADSHGGCIHLGERECSIQRRHQKLIEESPSPVVDPLTRARIGDFAVRAVRAAGYVNAGTVEFLRGEDGAFHFMEVNARLQVEHPVTEMVYGLDLVKAQIAVAAGEPLPIGQDEVELRGHAMECRVIAEDPARGFMPSPGLIRRLRTPGGPGIREDGGVYSGWVVPIDYDPLLSKLVAWGRDRQECVARMERALAEYRLEGPVTSIGLHRRILSHGAFREGKLHTGFLDEHKDLLSEDACDGDFERAAVLAAALLHRRQARQESAARQTAPGSRSTWRWGGGGGWR